MWPQGASERTEEQSLEEKRESYPHPSLLLVNSIRGVGGLHWNHHTASFCVGWVEGVCGPGSWVAWVFFDARVSPRVPRRGLESEAWLLVGGLPDSPERL